MPFSDRLEAVARLAQEAGAAILKVYATGAAGAGVTAKADESPLTIADERSHALIAAGLRRISPEIPVISEEDEASGNRPGATGLRWVVDPLDGTKEFIKRTDEFTVNIALVDSTVPVSGVVYAPALGVTWLGEEGRAERRETAGKRSIRTAAPAPAELRVVASRDHAGPEVRALLDRLPGARTLSMGSSLKFCLLAEGAADLYLRDGPTMEWDTAAAHAVLLAAGGAILTLDGTPLSYGKPDLRNPHFLALGDPALQWRELLVPEV